jgi:hypothetical protein
MTAAISPPTRRLYLIGDLHGEVDALVALDSRIAKDHAEGPEIPASVAHAGNYIDRGWKISELLEVLVGRRQVAGMACHYLRGDHERLMLSALDGGPREAATWLMAGAEASLHAWKAPRDIVISRLADVTPASHIAFLRSLAPTLCVQGLKLRAISDLDARDALFQAPPTAATPLAAAAAVPIGAGAAVFSGHSPPGWRLRNQWQMGRVACVAIERQA